MAVGERQRRKTASFSSSLLDTIYHSIDEPREEFRRNNAAHVEEEVESLRRAIMVEKWMENYTNISKSTHKSSNSASSTDSTTLFSSSETESSVSRSSVLPLQKPKNEGRFTRTKSKAMKMYGDLKKVKEPTSPGGKIANFLNSIFSPRNLKKNNGVLEEWRKSRSMKEDTTTRSCLTKNTTSSSSSSRGVKSKRSVRFCPAVSIIVDEDHCHQHSVGSQFIKKNIDSFHEFRRGFYENEKDVDDKSCASSDLFELENIGRRYDEELPVYGTTSIKINQAIASVNLYDY